MLLLGKLYSAKLNSNIEAAFRLLIPFLKSPLSQMVISFGLGYFVTTKISQIYGKLKGNSSKSQTDNESRPVNDNEFLPKQNQPIYTALNGKIFDLRPGWEKFASQGPYSHLAGCDANQVLHIACRSMGVCRNYIISCWEQSLRAEFNIVGFLIDSDMKYSGENVEMTEGSDTKIPNSDFDDVQ